MDVHQYVYSEDSALFGTLYSDVYDNSIRWTDGVVRALMDELFRRELLERTLVVVASDHGEAFGEHGIEGHARDLHAEVTEVPWILSFPFQMEAPGVVVTTPSANVDIWPTLLDLLDLPPLPDTDGRSRVPEMLAAARQEQIDSGEATFAQLDLTWGRAQQAPRPLVTVTQTGHRLMYRQDQPEKAKLYRIATDPLEQQDIASEAPELAARLRSRAEQHLASPPAPWGEASEVEIDELMLNQLRALGYKID
jgi:arylsulfatase A-like enzyme